MGTDDPFRGEALVPRQAGGRVLRRQSTRRLRLASQLKAITPELRADPVRGSRATCALQERSWDRLPRRRFFGDIRERWPKGRCSRLARSSHVTRGRGLCQPSRARTDLIEQAAKAELVDGQQTIGHAVGVIDVVEGPISEYGSEQDREVLVGEAVGSHGHVELLEGLDDNQRDAHAELSADVATLLSARLCARRRQ